ncbi:MAG: hypothetical protein IPP30_02080 [Flavobacterium sp.]|nr:hypothetical protein [Flavobacterium sp.]
MKKLILITLLVCFQQSTGQMTLKEFAFGEDKVFYPGFRFAPWTNDAKKCKPEINGSGDCPNFKQSGLPKKVALISFYAFDKGVSKTKKGYSYDYNYATGVGTSTHSKTITTTYNSDETASGLATAMFLNSIDKLKEMFTNGGMELLTPDEFLIDESKKEALKNFVPEGGVFNKVFKQDENIKSRGAASGFIAKAVNSDNADRPTWESYGKFARELGVDAVCIIMNEVESDSDNNVMLNKVGLYIFGPNPVAKDGNKRVSKYLEGMCYEGAYLMCGKVIQKGLTYTGDGVYIISNDKKSKGEYLDSYNKLAERFFGAVIGNLIAKKDN